MNLIHIWQVIAETHSKARTIIILIRVLMQRNIYQKKKILFLQYLLNIDFFIIKHRFSLKIKINKEESIK